MPATETRLRQSFSGTNPEAQRVAAKHAAKLVTAVTEEARANIRNLITRSIADGIPPRDAARMIRGMVGLNERQGQATMNYRARLVEQGLKTDRVESLTSKYAAKQLRSRAETIARTEVMQALNQGKKNSWVQARQNGLIGPDAMKEWLTSFGACPRCVGMHREKVPLDDSFPEGDPPLHPRCRCSLALSLRAR